MSNKSPEALRQAYNNFDRTIVSGKELWSDESDYRGTNYVTRKGRIDMLKSMNMLPKQKGKVVLPTYDDSDFLHGKLFKVVGETMVGNRLCKEYVFQTEDATYRIHQPVGFKPVLTEEQKVNPMLTLKSK